MYYFQWKLPLFEVRAMVTVTGTRMEMATTTATVGIIMATTTAMETLTKMKMKIMMTWSLRTVLKKLAANLIMGHVT